MSAGNARPRGSTEAAVYTHAVELMAARGYHGTSLRTVAKAVGVQMSSLYYYYPSKQELLLAIMRETIEDLTDVVRQAIEEADDPAAKLEAGIRAHVEFHADRRMETLITDSELRALEPENRTGIVELRDRYGKMFVEILDAGREQGAFDVPDTPVAVSALMTMCAGVATWYRPGGRLTINEIAEQYVHLFMQGVARRQAVAAR